MTVLGRRNFLELMTAALAAAGASACTPRRRGKILPYVVQPREFRPGRSTSFATSLTLGGDTIALLVESRDGRPIKVEGHPEHPSSRGAAGTLAQASVLDVYDVDRGRQIRQGAAPRSWKDVVAAFGPSEPNRPEGRYGSGRGLHFLLEPTSSPSLGDQLQSIERALPEARVHFYSPLGPKEEWAGARLAFGRVLEPHHDFARARVVASLGADFLGNCHLDCRYARQFIDKRRVRSRADEMNRLYVVETPLSITGMNADERLALRPSQVPSFAAMLLGELARAGGFDLPARLTGALSALPVAGETRPFLRALAQDLLENRGASLVLAGEGQPAVVHALVHGINELLGNAGSTIEYAEPLLLTGANASYGLEALIEALDGREVSTLVVLEGNPIYGAPAGFELERRFRSVPRRLYLGLYEDETAAVCDWFVPAAHYLESWGDARSLDGSVTFVQPLIEPLFGGRTRAELLAMFLGDSEANGRELLAGYWARNGLGATDDWENALARGFHDAPLSKSVPRADLSALAAEIVRLPEPGRGPLELWLKQDDKLYDGRFANNLWLQELPDPVTKLSWDNAALLAPKTATELGLETGDLVELRAGRRAIRVPVLELPGHAERSVTVSVGYGRTGAEQNARGVGANVWKLLDDGGPAPPVELEKLGRRLELPIAQVEISSEGRHPALSLSVFDYRAGVGMPRRHELPMLYFRAPGAPEQWAMSIDLTACTGCSACVVACQAENNVAVVGREWVLRRRQMHWLRIDRYFEGRAERPRVALQPMMCQHCEKAPCEYVCPVNATTHSDDGLNEMTYNRCVGTRFCSNNCPYKVRRFNYFDYTPPAESLRALVKNPDVTVRDRGVMEKCTYCVQRIRKAGIQARVEQRPLGANDVITACAQACPTRAIVFGSLRDPDSEVARLRKSELSYEALGELGVRPRTTYLVRLSNPNPELSGRERG